MVVIDYWKCSVEFVTLLKRTRVWCLENVSGHCKSVMGMNNQNCVRVSTVSDKIVFSVALPCT
jgi:hypothetical protein